MEPGPREGDPGTVIAGLTGQRAGGGGLEGGERPSRCGEGESARTRIQSACSWEPGTCGRKGKAGRVEARRVASLGDLPRLRPLAPDLNSTGRVGTLPPSTFAWPGQRACAGQAASAEVMRSGHGLSWSPRPLHALAGPHPE